ncbi:hypothetical protein [Streptomyces xinghaiensis]|uniref:hypothetical protein n=1 Tax=Streptomyces xinghaiensis TaxID=1038928 RepID=UPI00341C88D0
MTKHESYEARCKKAIEEINRAENIELNYSNIAPVDPWRGAEESVFTDLSESHGLNPDPLRRNFFAPDRMHAVWRSTSGPLMVGEFSLNHIHLAISRSSFPPDDWTMPAPDKNILGSLRVIDTAPHGGSGDITGLRLVEGSDPEVWFYDAGLHRIHRLDIGYAEYLDMVLLTKGTTGWQYLFADVQLGAADLNTSADMLETMFDTFPDLFPDHDYSTLRQRWEARL